VEAAIVERALGVAPGLGVDQADAVRSLCAAGRSLRSIAAPAGFGKTACLQAADRAADACGRPDGGVLADRRTAAQVVLGALKREPPVGLAVHDDPAAFERSLAAGRAAHLAVLADTPPNPAGVWPPRRSS